MKKDAKVLIIMGSDSDLSVMSGAASLLEEFGVTYEMTVASAHRTPALVHKHITNAVLNGVKVFLRFLIRQSTFLQERMCASMQ